MAVEYPDDMLDKLKEIHRVRMKSLGKREDFSLFDEDGKLRKLSIICPNCNFEAIEAGEVYDPSELECSFLWSNHNVFCHNCDNEFSPIESLKQLYDLEAELGNLVGDMIILLDHTYVQKETKEENGQ